MFRTACLVCSILLCLPALAQSLHYKVSGLKGAAKENVANYLESLPTIEPDRVSYRMQAIRETVEQALQALGYYQAEVSLVMDEQDPALLRVKVTPGKPVTIRTWDLQLVGEATQDESFAELEHQFPLKQGAVLHHGQYESIKAQLKGRALTRGYLDAKLTESKVKVYPRENVADVSLHFDSGVRYHFGEIRFDGVEGTQQLVEPLLAFKQGDPYRAVQLAELSQTLSQTRYFKQIDVQPEMDKIHDYQVPILIRLTPRSDNVVEVGVGASSDEGPRVQLTWEKPWINRYGHSLYTEMKISGPQQNINFSYRIPGQDPLNDYYSLQTSYEATDQQDTNSHNLTVGAHYQTKTHGSWERDYFLETQYEDYTQGSTTGSSLLLMPGFTLSRLRMTGGMDPDWGDRIIFKNQYSSRYWGSGGDFSWLWGRTKWLRSPWPGHRLIWRAEQGAILGDNIDTVPASLRFFTGGDQTVRGFSYESISPVDAEGMLTGARYVTAMSLEYAFPVAEKWRLASFVDAGTATNDYSESWKVGTGLGMRWLSPVGPIRLDLGFGVSETHIPFHFHFGLGPEL